MSSLKIEFGSEKILFVSYMKHLKLLDFQGFL